MSKDEIKLKPDQSKNFNKKENALDIRQADLSKNKCSLIEEGIIENCNSCSLKIICDGIVKVGREV